ncbi:MAG: hypothetical protein PGN15_14690 [Aeromicrobium erythreum]
MPEHLRRTSTWAWPTVCRCHAQVDAESAVLRTVVRSTSWRAIQARRARRSASASNGSGTRIAEPIQEPSGSRARCAAWS